jgi:hypothetical protein
MKKLELNQLKNYLGTGLMVFIDGYGEGTERLTSINCESEEIETNVDCASLDIVRPICYRLSDLDKMIPELGFVPSERLTSFQKGSELGNLSSFKTVGSDLDEVYNDIKKLFEWHFWIFDQSYFDEGIIIDKLTYK